MFNERKFKSCDDGHTILPDLLKSYFRFSREQSKELPLKLIRIKRQKQATIPVFFFFRDVHCASLWICLFHWENNNEQKLGHFVMNFYFLIIHNKHKGNMEHIFLLYNSVHKKKDNTIIFLSRNVVLTTFNFKEKYIALNNTILIFIITCTVLLWSTETIFYYDENEFINI